MSKDFSRVADKLGNSIRNLFARAVVKLVSDGLKMQGLQLAVLDGELIDDVEHPQPYGFTSHCHPGAEAFVAFTGGDRSHGIALVVDDRRYRIKSLKPGEVCIYTDEGDTITLKRDRNIEIKTLHLTIDAEEDCTTNTKRYTVNADARVEFNTPSFAMRGTDGGRAEGTIDGTLTATDDLKANDGGVSLRDHIHYGVQSGNSTTAKPVGG